MHDLRDLELAQVRPERGSDGVEDLFRLARCAADALDLLGRLPSAERVHDRLGRDEAVGESVGERVLQHAPEPVRQPVRSGIALRVVERDRAGREAFDRLTQGGADALVVADHLVRADLLHRRRVEAADDGDPLAGRGDEERSLPGAVHAGDQAEARVARERGLADEREPQVDVLLAQDLDSLVELLLNERRA